MDESAPWRALEGTSPARPPEEARGRGSPIPALAAVVVLCLASVALVAFVMLRPGGQVEVVGQPDASPGGPAMTTASVVVQVAGAVLRPGVYTLPAGSRVADAIKAAGGYSADVDPRLAEERLNLAAKLSDAEVVLVPRRGDDAAPSATVARGTGFAAASPGLIDLNTATAEQLDSLPGIGPATAAKIIAAREQAPFKSVQDLVTRKLVSESVFVKLKSLVTV